MPENRDAAGGRSGGLPVWAAVAIWVIVGAIAAGGAYLVVRDPGGEFAATASSSTSSSTTSSTATSTTVTTTTTVPATTTTAEVLKPGDACSVGSHPDCIDPEGDGTGIYLVGGADCMATFAPESPGLCSDLDGDGNAGYPDSG